MMKGSATNIVFLAFAASTAHAFVPQQILVSRTMVTSLRSATLETPPAATEEPTTWECDDDAQCVEVPACDEEACRTSLDVRIHGEWYDLSG